MSASTAISPRPQGSCVLCQAGGASSTSPKPSHALMGDASATPKRTNQPAGAISSSTPMANAACGSASMAGRRPNRRVQWGVPKLRASSSAVPVSARALAARPVYRLSHNAEALCGCAASATQAGASSTAAAAAARLHSSGKPTATASSSAVGCLRANAKDRGNMLGPVGAAGRMPAVTKAPIFRGNGEGCALTDKRSTRRRKKRLRSCQCLFVCQGLVGQKPGQPQRDTVVHELIRTLVQRV